MQIIRINVTLIYEITLDLKIAICIIIYIYYYLRFKSFTFYFSLEILYNIEQFIV